MKYILAAIILNLFIPGAIAQTKFDPALSATFDLLNNKAFAEIQLEDTSGQMFHTSSLLGKTVYVDFWFTTCAPCLKEIPFSRSLYQFFQDSTNLAFVGICIDNKENRDKWKQLVRDRAMPGIQLFYARNMPQTISLPKEYRISYPTYLLLNDEMKVTGYDAPRPSQEGWVHWALWQAMRGSILSQSYKTYAESSKPYQDFIGQYAQRIQQLRPVAE